MGQVRSLWIKYLKLLRIMLLTKRQSSFYTLECWYLVLSSYMVLFCWWLLWFTVKRGEIAEKSPQYQDNIVKTNSPLYIFNLSFIYFALRVCYFLHMDVRKEKEKIEANQLVYINWASIDHVQVNARHFLRISKRITKITVLK